MITIFSTPKPFQGHINTIQRNAIKSWMLLHPDIEVVLFGNEEGTAEVCAEFGIRHEPEVPRSASGAKYLDHMFAEAQRTARHAIVCYVNCDILLMPEFCTAASAVSARHPRFLMIGHRWDTPITQLFTFSDPTWQTDLKKFVRENGRLVPHYSIDYFVFPRGLYDRLPPLVIGRCWWDHWLVWKARDLGATVVDATPAVTAVHQNHDYAYHPQGYLGTLDGEEALENIRLGGGRAHHHTLLDATHELTPEGKFRRVHFRKPVFKTREAVDKLRCWSWYAMLRVTLPARHALGLRRRGAVENHSSTTRK